MNLRVAENTGIFLIGQTIVSFSRINSDQKILLIQDYYVLHSYNIYMSGKQQFQASEYEREVFPSLCAVLPIRKNRTISLTSDYTHLNSIPRNNI
jgi:hypothetical protein